MMIPFAGRNNPNAKRGVKRLTVRERRLGLAECFVGAVAPGGARSNRPKPWCVACTGPGGSIE